MPKLQQRRFEEPLCRVPTGPFLCQYEFAFARCGRWCGGPDVVIGRATTRGVQQNDLSKKLSPPTKWSYSKPILWSVGISFVALVMYVRSVMSHPGPASSFPVTLYAAIFPVALAVLLAAVWRHNHSTYSREYTEWSRSFVCERCGTVSQHDLARDSAA